MGQPRLPAIGCALALLVGGARCGSTRVVCTNDTTGYSIVYVGRGGLDACIRDPMMQTDGERRTASASAGHFDFGAGARWELGSGWTIEGQGADVTTIHASVPSASFMSELVSAILVRGAGVTLRGFTYDGDCWSGPAPAPSCTGPSRTSVAILVACGFGGAPEPDCDTDGLLLEGVRVRHADVALRASARPAIPPLGIVAIHANFQDFHWVLRNFRMPDVSEGERNGRIFDFGSPRDPLLSAGPGYGVTTPRSYRIDIVDTHIDTLLVAPGYVGAHEGVLLAAVDDDDVSLEIQLVDSSLRATLLPLELASQLLGGTDADDGRLGFRCVDSVLVADHATWDATVASPAHPEGCPPAPAAVSLAATGAPEGTHELTADFVRCEIRVEGSSCAAAVGLDLGGAGPAHTAVCLEDTPHQPAPPVGSAEFVEGAGPDFCTP